MSRPACARWLFVYGAIADVSGSLRASWVVVTVMLVLAGQAVALVPAGRTAREAAIA